MDNRNNQAQAGQGGTNAPQNRRLNLTPTDIVNQDFGHKMRGYDVEEVDNYLDLVIKDYETYNEQIKAFQQENNRLKSRIDELTKQMNAQGGPAVAGAANPGSNVSNYDILKRISNLERHVFGASKANTTPSMPRSYTAPRFSAPQPQQPNPSAAPAGYGPAPKPSTEPSFASGSPFQESSQPRPAQQQSGQPQQSAAPRNEPNPYQGGGTQYRNYGSAANNGGQPAPQPNNAPYGNPRPSNPAPQNGPEQPANGENNNGYRPQQPQQ